MTTLPRVTIELPLHGETGSLALVLEGDKLHVLQRFAVGDSSATLSLKAVLPLLQKALEQMTSHVPCPVCGYPKNEPH